MKKPRHAVCLALCLSALTAAPLPAQHTSLVNTMESPHARLRGVNMSDVSWTTGFWAERFGVCKTNMVPTLWDVYSDASVSHAFKNFEIAAGLDTGSHSGPPFHDGDFYKLLESMASLYAITKDRQLDQLMDRIIPVIAKAQRPDGYIHTPVIIEQRKPASATKEFEDRLNFETYNLGHLMTAACVHYRATGKKTLLNVAIKATDFLIGYYNRASPGLARNAICPSHYMGVVEMYRTTGNKAYLALAKNLIDIRGHAHDGTDHNQDRVPFRQQTRATGHAVRANYLYAGVADVYMESGDDSLLTALNRIWHDLVQHKMYVTGACGALYDGVSPDGTSYSPPYIQQVHQAYGRAYQLPNLTAHNESCANIGNVLWNWRMLQITGNAQYADVLELALYNSVLSSISLNGSEFFYTNPLAVKNDVPFTLRWSGGRQRYISLSNCCPPNIVRTIAEVSNYAYNVSDNGLWLNLYGSNTLHTKLPGGDNIALTQETNYPWDGHINIRLEKTPRKSFSLFFRIPGWCNRARLLVNGKPKDIKIAPGTYAEAAGPWANGDVIELQLDMPVELIEANPLVEETRNQVAVKRGPVVYCLESPDLPADKNIDDVLIPTTIELAPVATTIAGANLVLLEGKAQWIDDNEWKNELYRKIDRTNVQSIPIRLIPYYGWGNRGESEMTVWMRLGR